MGDLHRAVNRASGISAPGLGGQAFESLLPLADAMCAAFEESTTRRSAYGAPGATFSAAKCRHLSLRFTAVPAGGSLGHRLITMAEGDIYGSAE